MEFVNTLKQYILQTSDGSLDSLLLSLGTLSSKAQADIQLDIAQFLIRAASNGDLDTSTIIIIMAMGNTGSNAVVNTILQYVDDPVKDIQISGVSSMELRVLEHPPQAQECN